MIVSGRGHAGHFLDLLGSGKEIGLDLAYEVQEEAGGIAQALGLTEYFADNDKIVVILGDNVFEDNLTKVINDFEKQERGAKILLKEVGDPERFGVAEISGDKIIGIKEKPKKPKSKYAVTGIYMYDNRAYDIIKTLKPSARGELEITDVNNAYIKEGTMTHEILKGWWTDAGTFDSLLKANNLVAKK
jgi:glucose-1-phosphate thymidylyltransferase